MTSEVQRATGWGIFVTLLLGILIVIGSRNLSHFDAALIAYTFAVLFATFGLTYRYAMWLQRPPTAVYWRRGWQLFFNPRYFRHNLIAWGKRVIDDFILNRFILARNRLRGVTHLLIMWGCVIAIAITFPLVFGWLHFESVPGNLELYRVSIFGFPTFTFPVESILGFFLFHGLVWSSFLVIGGVMLAMRRRMREEGAAALQLFAEDFLPLILLFAVSITGLMLTASYTWLKGYGYDFIAILHAITVIATFLWLPFGKFFHIFQRPAQIGVQFYKDAGERVEHSQLLANREEEAAHCRRCGVPFTSRMHVEDLIQTQRALGYTYEMDGDVEHYQWICPPCRRALLALAQGQMRETQWGGADRRIGVGDPVPTPAYANPALGEGPLGEEDARNFHP